MIVKPNETRALELRNKNVEGLSLKVVGKLASGQTQNLKVNLTKTILKVKLFRGGREKVLMNDILLPLVIESAFRNGTFSYTQGSGATFLNLDGGEQNMLKMLPLLIDFGGVLNIKGDDVLTIELICNAETFLHPVSNNTVNVDLNQCYIQVDETEGIGLEYKTPYVVSKAISGGESRLTLSLGDNIESLFFINTLSNNNYVLSDSPVESLSLSSDKISFSDDLREMIAKRAKLFQSPADAELRNHSFLIHQGTELDAVNIDLSMIPGKVLAGENYIVYRTFETSAELISKANRRAQRHSAYDLSKVPAKV